MHTIHIMGPTPSPKPTNLHRSCSFDERLRRNGCHSLDVVERVYISHLGDGVYSIRKKGTEEKDQKEAILYLICWKMLDAALCFSCGNYITLSRYIPTDTYNL